eukprot:CAMPEP_0113916164 /NCGR_PEP_ID=MMETSP0780_2-20120614/31829_1 /TAXON_ID=652834 /ORGANISM="Palpitomonas bilix" /LENGTH=710 /DNA_ID=CAMNT_0000915201 /DNA_START=278 /DNA_END=2411 /DNA_ORIENTATION=+ /assembly_acc=CAM_ASM_000599
MTEPLRPRRHGCHAPFDPLQISAWFFILPLLISFYGAITPFFSSVLSTVTTAVYSILIAIIVVTYVLASITDVGHKNVIAKYGGSRKNKIVAEGEDSKEKDCEEKEGEEGFYCYTCKVQVGKKSKHCRVCNKCVEDFDHHCRWLNTCVGSKTYKVFITLLSSLFLLLVLHFSLASAGIIDVAVYNHSSGVVDVQKVCTVAPYLCHDEHDFPTYYLVILGSMLILCIPFGGLVGQLLFLHFYLMAKGLSTYEYILLDRAKQTEKARKKQRREAETAKRKLAHSRAAAGKPEGSPSAKRLQELKNGNSELAPQELKKSDSAFTVETKDSARVSIAEKKEDDLNTLERMKTPVVVSSLGRDHEQNDREEDRRIGVRGLARLDPSEEDSSSDAIDAVDGRGQERQAVSSRHGRSGDGGEEEREDEDSHPLRPRPEPVTLSSSRLSDNDKGEMATARPVGPVGMASREQDEEEKMNGGSSKNSGVENEGVSGGAAVKGKRQERERSVAATRSSAGDDGDSSEVQLIRRRRKPSGERGRGRRESNRSSVGKLTEEEEEGGIPPFYRGATPSPLPLPLVDPPTPESVASTAGAPGKIDEEEEEGGIPPFYRGAPPSPLPLPLVDPPTPESVASTAGAPGQPPRAWPTPDSSVGDVDRLYEKEGESERVKAEADRRRRKKQPGGTRQGRSSVQASPKRDLPPLRPRTSSQSVDVQSNK